MRSRVVVVVVLLVAVAAIWAHEGHVALPSRGAKFDAEKGTILLSKETREALDVQTVEIGLGGPIESIHAYTTLISPWQGRAFASSRLSGQVVAVRARPGERIVQGQVLAEVKSPEVEVLQLDLLSAANERRLAEKVWRFLKNSGGVVSEMEVRAADNRVKQAHIVWDVAEAKWRALGLPAKTLAEIRDGKVAVAPTLPIRSSIAGTIIHADLDVGTRVDAGAHLFEIVDPSVVWAEIHVLERDIDRIEIGMPVEIRLTARPAVPIRATVAGIGQIIDPKTHLSPVWVELRNPTGSEPKLLPGMSGRASMEFAARRDAKTVPSTSLINDGVDHYVLVEDANAEGMSEYRKISVVVVRETPEVVEVRSGDLFPGDRVVTRGSAQMGAYFTPSVLKLTPQSTETLGITVEPAALHSVSDIIDATGTIDLPPWRRSANAPPAAGTLESIRVTRGQAIVPDQILAEIFSLDAMNLQLEWLREHLSAELNREQAVQMKKMIDTVGQKLALETEAAAIASENRRDSLRKRLNLLGLMDTQLDEIIVKRHIAETLPVRATSAGAVVEFPRVLGQSLKVEDTLFPVHDLTRPWIRVSLLENETNQVRLGQSAHVRSTSRSGQLLQGKVVRNSGTLDPASRSLSTWIELDRDALSPLRQNQMVHVVFDVGVHAPTLAVPIGAIAREGNAAHVFVRTEDRFERKSVQLGRTDARFTEVVAGLTAGELVVVTGTSALQTAYASIR